MDGIFKFSITIFLLALLMFVVGCNLENKSLHKSICLNSTETYKAYTSCMAQPWEEIKSINS